MQTAQKLIYEKKKAKISFLFALIILSERQTQFLKNNNDRS